MSSEAYRGWISTQAEALDQMENAHSAVGGKGRGRRHATEQINHAYTVLLASQFQGFCREIHSEGALLLSEILEPPGLRPIVLAEFTRDRKLDRGNATPGNLGEDFGRLGVTFWYEVKKISPRNEERRDALDRLNVWRNAIVHQDFDHAKLASEFANENVPTLGLAQVRKWRSACGKLAWSFDSVIREHILSVTGKSPW